MSDFVKTGPQAPEGYFAAEAAGLAWLAAPDVIPVVRVLEVADDHLRLERLESVPPTAEAAREAGRRLARLHDAGAPEFGFSPVSAAWFGPLEQPFPVPTREQEDFADFWARDRLQPVADRITRRLGVEGSDTVDEAIDAIAQGTFDGISGQGVQQPARVHGDLWSGNLLWTPRGVTLIDPSAHGGHRLEDLALLALFGAPHLDALYAGYEEEHPMPADWREDLPAHLFFALLAHVQLFGGSYAAQAVTVAERIIARAGALRRG